MKYHCSCSEIRAVQKLPLFGGGGGGGGGGGECSQDHFGLGILFGGFSGQHLTFAEHISPFQSRVSFGVNIEHLGVRD